MGLDGSMSDSPVLFRERLSPAPWVYLATALMLPAVFFIVLPIDVVGAAITSVVVYALILLGLSATTPELRVEAGELRAGTARIPLSFVGEVTGFREEEAFLARGQRLDTRAWLLLRGWIDPVARIEITDPDDPAPYWLVSTRRPEALAAAIAASPRTGSTSGGS